MCLCVWEWERERETVCIHHVFFPNSSVNGYLVCFHSFVIQNSAAIIMGIQMSLWGSGFYLPWIYPEVGPLDHMQVLFLASLGVSILFSIMFLSDEFHLSFHIRWVFIWVSSELRWVPYTAAAAVAKSLQSRPTLCDPIEGSPPGFPVPGILQARILEWVAISFSRVPYEFSIMFILMFPPIVCKVSLF